MHIETLKVFCDVVETGSFSVAASQNFITQSAVSQQLRALETKYHCKLLERSRGGAKPTPQGTILYKASREIIDKYRDVESELQHSCDVVGGHLRVAIVYSVGLHELPAYLKEYLRSYPDVNVHVEYSRPNKIYENVIAQQIDLGIVAYPQKHPQIVTIAIREDHLVLACPPDHHLADTKKVSVSQLKGEPFVAYEKDIATRKATDQMLRNHHVTVEYSASTTTSRPSSAPSRSVRGWRSSPSRRFGMRSKRAPSRSPTSPTRTCPARSGSSTSGAATCRRPRSSSSKSSSARTSPSDPRRDRAVRLRGSSTAALLKRGQDALR